MSNTEKLVYTELECCEVLGICRATLYKLRVKGKIAHTRIGRQIRFTKKQIEDFLADHEVSFSKKLIKKFS